MASSAAGVLRRNLPLSSQSDKESQDKNSSKESLRRHLSSSSSASAIKASSRASSTATSIATLSTATLSTATLSTTTASSSSLVPSSPWSIAKVGAVFRALYHAAFFVGSMSACVVFIMGANVVQLLIFPLKWTLPRVWHSVNSGIGYCTWMLFLFCWDPLSSAGSVTVTGKECIVPDASAVYFANHCSYTDVYVAMAVAQRANHLGFIRGFVKESVMYYPFFGWGMYLMGQIFLKRNWKHDEATFASALGLLTKNRLPVWLEIYPEGSRFTKQKLAQSQTFAKGNDMPILQHVLLPRPKGFSFAIQNLRNTHVKYVYDVTVAYYSLSRGWAKPVRTMDILLNRIEERYRAHLHIERFDLDTLPTDEQGIAAWLLERFVAKDALMERLKTAAENGTPMAAAIATS